MKENINKPIKGMAEQMFEMWEEAFRNTVKMQEGMFKNVSGGMNTPEWTQEMQSQMGKMKTASETIRPTIQKRTDDMLELMQRNSQLESELRQLATEAMKQPMTMTQPAKWIEYWKLAMSGLCGNAEVLVQMETRAMNSWIDFTRKSCELK